MFSELELSHRTTVVPQIYLHIYIHKYIIVLFSKNIIMFRSDHRDDRHTVLLKYKWNLIMLIKISFINGGKIIHTLEYKLFCTSSSAAECKEGYD